MIYGKKTTSMGKPEDVAQLNKKKPSKNISDADLMQMRTGQPGRLNDKDITKLRTMFGK